MLFVNRRARKSNERGPVTISFSLVAKGSKTNCCCRSTWAARSPTPTRPSPTPPSEWISQAAASLILSTALPSKAAGTSVADVGDVNGDGFEDYAIAATGANLGLINTAYVSVIFGSNVAGSAANGPELDRNHLDDAARIQLPGQ